MIRHTCKCCWPSQVSALVVLAGLGCSSSTMEALRYRLGGSYRAIEHDDIRGAQAVVIAGDASFGVPLVKRGTHQSQALMECQFGLGFHGASTVLGIDMEADVMLRLETGGRIAAFGAAGFGRYLVATNSGHDVHYALEGTGPVFGAGVHFRPSTRGGSGLEVRFTWRRCSGTRTWWGMGWESENITALVVGVGVAMNRTF